MKLNTIGTEHRSATYRRRRVGRGCGSGYGKTCGRGHKGQKSRSGGYHKIYFEGGQMPLQRRLPKSGFNSRKAKYSEEVFLRELGKVNSEQSINLEVLQKAGLVSRTAKQVKIVLSGSIQQAVQIVGLKVTRGAHRAIEAAGGTVVDD